VGALGAAMNAIVDAIGTSELEMPPPASGVAGRYRRSEPSGSAARRGRHAHAQVLVVVAQHFGT